MPDSPHHVGRVTFYDAAKQFGFAEDVDAGGDVYLGPDALLSPPLVAGDLVRFVSVPPDRPGKRSSAKGVERLSPTDALAAASAYPQLGPQRRLGVVKFYDADKGFGFVSDLDGGEDAYVGSDGLLGPISVGDLVAFNTSASAKGKSSRASSVRRLRDEPQGSVLALHAMPVDVQSWLVRSSRVRTIAPFLSPEGWIAIANRAADAWTVDPKPVAAFAAVAFNESLAGAVGDIASAPFRERICTHFSASVQAMLWKEGWREAFTLEAALGEARTDARGALRRTPTHAVALVTTSVLRASPVEADGLFDDAFAGARSDHSSPKTPADRRACRRDMSGDAHRRLAGLTAGVLDAAVAADVQRLFLDGYHDGIDLGLVIGLDAPLSRPRVEGLLALPALTLLQVERVLLDAARWTTAAAEHDDTIEWFAGLASRYLEPEASRRVTDRLYESVPSATLTALWNDGQLTVPPLEALVERAGWTLTPDGLARAVECLAPHEVTRLVDARLIAQVRLWRQADKAVQRMFEIRDANYDNLTYTASYVLEAEGLEGGVHVEAWIRLEEEIPLTLDVANATLDASALAALVSSLLPLTDPLHVLLWSGGAPLPPPREALLAHLRSHPQQGLADVIGWLDAGRSDTDVLEDVLNAYACECPPVTSAADLVALQSVVDVLQHFDLPAPSLDGLNAHLMQAAEWIQSPDLVPGFDPVVDRRLPVYFSPADQVRILRKLAALHECGQQTLTAAHLRGLVRVDAELDALAQEHHGLKLDLSAEVCIQLLVGLLGSSGRLPEGGLLRIAYRGLAEHPDRPLSLAGLDVFESCPGRMEAVFRPRNTAGAVRPHEDGYVVSGCASEPASEALQQIPQSLFDARSRKWTVPLNQKAALVAVARAHRFELHLTDAFKTDNRHLFAFIRDAVPTGVTYCEGRQSLTEDAFHERPFWWCGNQPCFQNAETAHRPEEWESYTLLDAARALGCELDEHRGGETIPDGRYYSFVGAVNRVNRLLPHLKCRSCSDALYPQGSSHFAHYRVTQFECRSPLCPRHEETVYLHHCLRGRCGSIIDSRDTQKCPNGWYVCTNPSCGACCSDAALRRRDANLTTVGAGGSSAKTTRGHLEHAEAFCCRCSTKGVGTAMHTTALPNSRGDGQFECPRCDTTYTRGR